ncbi:MAG: prepilin peptidase [Syntrophomonadaceae bacterium]|nr:prepilin peptidase [Syntrophomonadaceae bacterium]
MLIPGLVVGIVVFIYVRWFCEKEKAPLTKPWLISIIPVTIIVLGLIINQYGYSLIGLRYGFLASLLIAVTYIDLKLKIIPNQVIIVGFLAGIIFALNQPRYYLAGAITGFIFLLLIYLLSRGGIGEGDLKLALVIGLFLGYPLVAVSLILTYLIGGVFFAGLLLLKKIKIKQEVAFGPYMALGAVIAMIHGINIMKWYFGFVL